MKGDPEERGLLCRDSQERGPTGTGTSAGSWWESGADSREESGEDPLAERGGCVLWAWRRHGIMMPIGGTHPSAPPAHLRSRVRADVDGNGVPVAEGTLMVVPGQEKQFAEGSL